MVSHLARAQRVPRQALAQGGQEDRSAVPDLARFNGLLLWAVILLIFTIWIPGLFWTSANWQTLATDQAITGVVAMSAVITLSAGGFDLSMAQNVVWSSLLVGVLMTQGPHMSPAEAILVTLACGAVIGAANGLLVAHIGMNSFIATLGTTSLLEATSAMIGKGNYIGPFPQSFTNLTDQNPIGIPLLVVYLFAIAILLWYLLEHTPVGRRVHATGANAEAARLAGVRTRRYLFWSFVAGGTVASFAGIMLASSVNSASEGQGTGYLLPAFAAVFLGTTQLKPGRFNVWGTVIAIYLLGTGVQGVELVSNLSWITDVFNGVALLLAVSIFLIAGNRRTNRASIEFEDDEPHAEIESVIAGTVGS